MLTSRFRLIRRLGSGGLGEVWLAEDVREGRETALKLLGSKFCREPSHVELFRREFSLAQSLVHPAIVRPEDFFSADSGHFFTMPVMPGGHIGASPGAPWSESVRRLLPLCDALAYAHRKGVVHGDIKPQNILLDESNAACLTDFGAAHIPEGPGAKRIRRPGGTLAYMSPQQLEGRPAQVSDDVYALGCGCYELFCGFPPYAPDISEERVRSGKLAAPEAPDGSPQLPKALCELVMAMLARDRARRPVTMQAVRARLEEILDESTVAGEPVEAAAIVARARNRPAGGAPAPMLQRRSGVPIWLAYALGALLLAVAISLFVALPRFAEERAARRPLPQPVAQEPEAPQEDKQLLRFQRDAADEAMGGMLQDRNYLASLQPALWSGGAWEQAIAQEQEADDYYRRREYPDAQVGYRKAGDMLRQLRERAPEIGRESLKQAQEAIESGDQASALEALEKAEILLGETEAAVQLARRRTRKLPEVMQAVEKARAARRDGSLEDQRQAWQSVLQLDPERQSARRALAAVNAAVDQQLFDTRMSRGHAALGDGDLSSARTAFEAAKKQRPGDPAPVEALTALDLEERGQRLAELQAGAMAGKFREDWRAASANYQGMLEIDANIVAVQKGLAEAQRRVRLDDGLENTIANAAGLNREDAWQRGKRLLDEAGAIPNPGRRLSRQISSLEQVLTVAATPALVQLRSDGLTQVTIYHVGRLGSFDNRVMQLRPGAYTAIGTRDGYRDVRRDFVVAPEGLSDPLVLVCTEPI